MIKNLFVLHLIILMKLLLLPHLSFSQSICINEIMPTSESALQDIDGDTPDWVELYNSDQNAINLLGYYLSDDERNLKKWAFPSGVIHPKSYLLIFASGKDTCYSNEYHTNFKISSSKEYVFLSNNNGEIIDRLGGVIPDDAFSLGRFPDGDTSAYFFTTPSPLLTNVLGQGVFASHKGGFYSNSINVKLDCQDKAAQIYYTTDGTEPDINSLLYNGTIKIKDRTAVSNNYSTIPSTPLTGPDRLLAYIWKAPKKNVFKGTILRYRSYIGELPVSEIYTHSYFVTPEAGGRYNYPVISIVADSAGFFGYENGIYVPGINYDEKGWNWEPIGNYHMRDDEWERRINLEVFNVSGQSEINITAGVMVNGYGSAIFPQKSLKLFFRSEYGASKLNYSIFSNEIDSYNRLGLRNSGNDFLHTHFKDAFLQDLLSELDIERQSFTPGVVFVNSEYWGVYNIKERYDKHYFESHFGVEEDSLILVGICGNKINGSNSEYVDLINFIKDNNVQLEENYKQVEEWIDIENMLDYYIAELYYGNIDWPSNNYKMWKTTNPDSKWRWLIYDLDLSYNYSQNCSYDFNSLEFATEEGGTSWPNADCSTLLLRKLLENEEFKNLFINRFIYHLKNAFYPKRVLEKSNEFKLLFAPEMEEHINRWSYPNSMNQWNEYINSLNDFTINRPCYMQEYLKDFFHLDTINFDCNAYFDEIDQDFTFKVFPNPNNGLFILKWDSKLRISVSVEVISLYGEVVFTEKLFYPNDRKELDLSYLPVGVYFLRYYTDRESGVEKFLIVR